MLYQELPQIDSTPLDGWGRWLVPALVGAAAATAAVVLLLAGQPLVAAAALLLGLAGAGFAYWRTPRTRSVGEPLVVGPDYSVVGSAMGLCQEPAALTTGEGSLLIANAAYRERFGGSRPPLELGADDSSRRGLDLARTMAWRDGGGCVAAIATHAGS